MAGGGNGAHGQSCKGFTAGPREEVGPSEARHYGSIILAATEPTVLSTLALGDSRGRTVLQTFPAPG